MAGKAGEAFVEVKPDTSGFGSALGSDVESRSKQIGAGMQKVGAAMSIGITAPLTALGFQAVQSASQLEDVSAAAEVTFGKASGSVASFADTALQSFGITETAALDAATQFAALGKSAGLQGKELSGFSTQMVGLAGDLASFRGTSVEEALTAIGSGLRGEAEPLRRYGVLLDDASLRQEAMRQGLIKTTKEALTPQQKVLAAQSLILKQTGDAQGDFQRTSDSTANTLKVLQGSFSELVTNLGQALLPVITSVANAVIPWLEKFQTLSPTVKTVIVVVGALVAAIGPLLLVIGTFITLAPAIGTALSVAFGPVGLIIAAVVALTIVIVKNWGTIKRVTLAAWNAVKRATLAVWNAIKAIVVGVAKFVWTAIKLYFGFYRAIIEGAWNGIKIATSAVWEFIRGIPDKIIGIFSGAGRWLFDAGRDVVTGLWEGIKSMASWITGLVIQWAKDILPGPIEHLLGIGSPSKLFRKIGQEVPRGLALGIDDEGPQVQRAVERLRPSLAVPGERAFRGARRGVALTGSLTLTPESKAYVRGVIVEEDAASARHARTVERMRARRSA